MSQSKLSDMLKVKESTISRYENGMTEIPASLLPIISEILHFSPAEFFSDNIKYVQCSNNRRICSTRPQRKQSKIDKYIINIREVDYIFLRDDETQLQFEWQSKNVDKKHIDQYCKRMLKLVG